MIKSIIQAFCLENFHFFVKREDLLGDFINGNKARKLAFFISKASLFQKGTSFVSYGSAQSNALAALAYFTYKNDFKLIFACETLPSFLRQNPSGNFAQALQFKAKIIEKTPAKLSLKEFALALCKDEDIFVPEGLACARAEQGFKELAAEIKAQEKDLQFDIFLSSGTGTSALFLAKNLPTHQIYTTPCVGDEEYLRKQILSLEPCFEFKNLHILSLEQKYHFAKPHKDLLDIYQKALHAGLEFDLLYDTMGLLCVLKYQKLFKRPLLYIHQGGLGGNLSQLERYKFKGFLK